MKRVNIKPKTLQEIANELQMYIAQDESGLVYLYGYPPAGICEKLCSGDLSKYWKQNPIGGNSICLTLLMQTLLPKIKLNKIITDLDTHDWRVLITPKCFSALNPTIKGEKL